MNSKGMTLIEVLIVVATVGLIIAIIAIIAQASTRPSREERCHEICDGLRQRRVKVTPDICICEDPETKARQGYPLNGAGGQYPANYKRDVWEMEN